jgi:NAD(P)-dependent dehydrogenase (short-subunit alcohol dehydrogenase family)
MPNHQQLKGKVVAVIGASRGIGASAARALAQAGASVAVGARDLRRLEQLAGELREDGGEAVAFPVDVRDPAQVESFIGRTVETLGRLDGAFNNAGIPHPPVELAKLSLEQMDQTLSTDLRGTLLAMKAEVQAMRAHGGSIVNMASTAGLQGARGLSDYSAAKHGVIGASKSVALEFAPQRVRVNVVAPGPILNDRIAALTEEQRAPIVRAVPLGRIGRPEDVAAAVVWLCSDESSFVTGAVLPVDGGRLAGFFGGG